MPQSLDKFDEMLQKLGSSTDDRIDESLGVKDNTLEVIDGDTVKDNITGRIFRFKGYDSLETIDSKKAQELENESGITPDNTTGSSMLEMMINTGKITAKDIYNNYTGKRDKYGRLLVDIPELADLSIASGKAVSSNKYDRKRQELANKEIEKLYALGEDDRAKELEALKEYNNDATDDGLGFLGRPWNDLKGAYASLGRASSSIGDFALDTTSALIDTALGSKKGDALYLGDSTYFNKLKDKEYSNRLNSYDDTESNIALDEGLHNLKIGWNSKNSHKMKYAKAAWEAFKQADALFSESAGDMALMMTPVGESGALLNASKGLVNGGSELLQGIEKTKAMLEGAKGLALKNGGLLSYTLGETNTALEERAKNNLDGETSGSAINTFTFLLAKNALDRLAFQSIIKGKAGASNIDNIKKLLAGSSPTAQRALTTEMLTSAIDLSKRAATGGAWEGSTEAVQTYGELLATTLGTDAFGNNFPKDQKTIDTVLKGALAGLSIGAGMSSVHSLPDTTRRLGEDRAYQKEQQAIKDEADAKERARFYESISTNDDGTPFFGKDNEPSPNDTPSTDGSKATTEPEPTKEDEFNRLGNVLSSDLRTSINKKTTMSQNEPTPDGGVAKREVKFKDIDGELEFDNLIRIIDKTNDRDKIQTIIDNSPIIRNTGTITKMSLSKLSKEELLQTLTRARDNFKTKQSNTEPVTPNATNEYPEPQTPTTEPSTQQETTVVNEPPKQDTAKKIDTKRAYHTVQSKMPNYHQVMGKEVKTVEDASNSYNEVDNLEKEFHDKIGKDAVKEIDNISNEIQNVITDEEYDALYDKENPKVPKSLKDKGYTLQDIDNILNIKQVLDSIQTAKASLKSVVDNNPITKNSISDNESANISAFMDMPNVDTIRTEDKSVQEQIDKSKEYNQVKDKYQVSKEIFTGDNNNVGISQWESRLSDATPKQIEESGYKRFVGQMNDKAIRFKQALVESRATGKRVSLGVNSLGTEEYVDANHNGSVKLVDRIEREAKAVNESYNNFLKSRGGIPSETSITNEPSQQDTKEDKQIKEDKKVVGSHISNIEKASTIDEAKDAFAKGLQDLQNRKLANQYANELKKSFNTKKKELTPVKEDKRASRLERKIDELQAKLDGIYQTKDGKWKKRYKGVQKEINDKKKKIAKLEKDLETINKRIENTKKFKKGKKSKLNKDKKSEILPSLREVIVEKIKQFVKEINSLITKLFKNKEQIQKELDSLNKELSALIELQVKSKQYRTNEVSRKQNINVLMSEYKKKLKATGKLTDGFIAKINTIDKGFYNKLQKMKLPKGVKFGLMKAFETWDLISQSIEGTQGNDYSTKDKEIQYFNNIVRPLIKQARELVQNISDRGEIFAMDFNKEDSDKYNEMLNGLDENTLVNLVTFVAIDGMMNQGGEMFNENTDEDIATLLGLNSEHDVTVAMKSRFKYGKLQSNIISSMSNLMNEYISLQSNNPLAKERFGSAIALLATHLLRTSNLANVEQFSMTMKEFNAYRAIPYSTDSNKRVNFLRANDKSPIRGKGKAVLKKVFRMHLPEERTTPHEIVKDEAINKQQQAPRQIKQEIIDLYQELGEKEFRDYLRTIMGYDFKFANTAGIYSHTSKHASIKGKNLQIDDSIDTLMEVIETIGNTPMYYKYKRASEERMHLVAELINPQSNKLHRFLTHNINSKRTVDIKDEGRMLIWKSAILDSFGMKSENMKPDEILEEFGKLLLDSELMSYLNDKSIYPPIELVQKYGEGAYTLQGLVELKKFVNKKGDIFETTLEKETDAKQSGSTLQSIFYFNPLDSKSVEMLHKGGIYTNQTDTTKNTDYVGLDNYEESGIEMHNRLQDKDNDYEHNRKPEPPKKELKTVNEKNAYYAKVARYNLFNNFFKPMLESWVVSDTLSKGSEALRQARNFFKTPIIAKGYTAGDKSIQDSKFDEMIDDFYTKIEDIANGKSTKQEIQLVVQMVQSIVNFNKDSNGKEVKLTINGKVQESQFNDENIQELMNHLNERLHSLENPTNTNKYNYNLNDFEFTAKQLATLRTNYRNTLGKVITDSINKVLAPFKQGTEITQRVSNLQNKYFLDEFFRRLDAYHKEHGFISKQVINEITNKLIKDGIAPVLTTFEGRQGELMKRGFNDQINNIIKGKNYQVKVATKGKDRHLMSTQTIGVTSWIDIGVRTPALSTLMTDSGVLADTIKNTSQENIGLYIFDAVLSAEGGAKQYNKSVNKLIDSGYSPFVEVLKNAKIAFNNYEWTKENINAMLPKSVHDMKVDNKIIPYTEYATDRLFRFYESLDKDKLSKKQIDSMMIGTLSTVKVGDNGSIYFDPISIDFHIELNQLNRRILKDIVTTIEHSVGVDERYVKNESNDFKPIDTTEHKKIYDKYKEETNEKLGQSESLTGLNNEINNYTPKTKTTANDLNYEHLMKNGSNPELSKIELEDVLEAFDKIPVRKLESLTGYALVRAVNEIMKDSGIEIIQLDKTKLNSHLTKLKKAKQEINNTKQSLDTNEEFKPYFTFKVNKENIIKSFEKIKQWSNDVISSEYSNKLSNVLSSIIAPVMETIVVAVGKTDSMSYGSASGSNVAKIAIANQGSDNMSMSAQEVYVHELVHNIFDGALKDANIFVNQITDMMKELKQQHGKDIYKLFLPKDGVYTVEDEQLAKRMAKHVFGGKGDVSEFAAYGLTNKNFMNNLSGMNTILNKGNGSILSNLVNIVTSSLKKLTMLLTNGRIDLDMQSKLQTLVKQSVGITIENENKVFNGVYKALRFAGDKYNENIKPNVNKLAFFYHSKTLKIRSDLIKDNKSSVFHIIEYMSKDSDSLKRNISKFIVGDTKTIAKVLAIMAMNNIPFSKKEFGYAIGDIISKGIDSMSKARIDKEGFLNNIVDELQVLGDNIFKTAKDTSIEVQELRNSIKEVDIVREKLRTNTHEFINEKIQYMGLNEYEKSLLGNLLNSSKVGNLLDVGYSIDQILSLIENPNEEIRRLEKLVPKKSIPHIKKLVKYRLTHDENTKFRNIHVIATRFDFSKKNEMTALASLLGIKNYKKEFLSKVTKDKNAFHDLMIMTNSYEREMLEQFYHDNPDLVQDGLAIQNSSKVNSVVNILDSNKDEIKRVRELGGERIKIIKNPFSPGNIHVYSLTPEMNSYTRGALVYGEKSVSQDIDKLYFELYGRARPNFVKIHNTEYVFNRNGSRYDYDPLSFEEKKKYLKYSYNIADIYANQRARGFEKQKAKEVNIRVIDSIVRLGLEDNETVDKFVDKTDNKEWIKISAPFASKGFENKVSEYDDIWYMLPQDTRDYIVDKYKGRFYIPANGNTKNIFLGSRDSSISSIFNDIPTMKKVAKFAEDFWKELMGLWKATVIIKYPLTLLSNFVSNLFLTKSKGYSLRDIYAKQKEGLLYLNDYMRTDDLLKQEELKRDSGLLYDEELITDLQSRLNQNKIRSLIDDGLLSARIEDITINKAFESLKPIRDAIDKVEEILPEKVVKIGRELYLAEDTNYFKLMYHFTQASDFTARYAQIELEKENNTNKSYQQIYDEALDDFVQYDIPLGKAVRWADQVAWFPFIKYYLRMQKVMSRLLRENPKTVLAIEAFEKVVYDIATPFENYWLLMTPDEKMRNPFGNIEDLIIPAPVHIINDML